MAVTQLDRFVITEDGFLYDKLTTKTYESLEEFYNPLTQLNDYVFDFEEEINRQARELNVLIEDLDEDCHQS